jgi:hypothetical protein
VSEAWQTSAHVDWFKNTGQTLKTNDGKDVEVWEFQHQPDNKVLSAWAKHFRNHYCLDNEIDVRRGKRTRQDFLNVMKFPSETSNLGPPIRAGDFGEILVADFLEWILGFTVPRIRWSDKVIQDESPKGSDVIGFKLYDNEEFSPEDILLVIETKTKFSKTKNNRLQDAINYSVKNSVRLGESLNFIRQQFINKNRNEQIPLVDRFQSPADIPYHQRYGAAAFISDEYYTDDEITLADCTKIPKLIDKKTKEIIEYIPHPYKNQLILFVFKGNAMMSLVHELYRRAADEA